MKIVSINASPNKLGSTSKLLSIVEDELKSLGHQVTRYDLYDYTYKGCIACNACSKPETNYCSQQDELIPILEKIDHSACLLFGSPIYIGHITGEGKSFIDRLYTFLCSKERSKDIKKKVFSFVITQGADLKYFRTVRAYLNEWFFDYMGLVNGGSLSVGELGGAEDLKKQPKMLVKAKKLAKQIDDAFYPAKIDRNAKPKKQKKT